MKYPVLAQAALAIHGNTQLLLGSKSRVDWQKQFKLPDYPCWGRARSLETQALKIPWIHSLSWTFRRYPIRHNRTESQAVKFWDSLNNPQVKFLKQDRREKQINRVANEEQIFGPLTCPVAEKNVIATLVLYGLCSDKDTTCFTLSMQIGFENDSIQWFGHCECRSRNNNDIIMVNFKRPYGFWICETRFRK